MIAESLRGFRVAIYRPHLSGWSAIGINILSNGLFYNYHLSVISRRMLEIFFQILFLLLATNGMPVLVARIFQSHGDVPVDFGRRLRDGHPVFGSSKTWRGLISAIATSCILSIMFGYGSLFGLVFGLLVMTGDLCSSFVKRRRGLAPGTRTVGWDQVPESLIASIYAAAVLGVTWWWAVVWMLTFALVQMLLSRPLYWLRIRKNPY